MQYPRRYYKQKKCAVNVRYLLLYVFYYGSLVVMAAAVVNGDNGGGDTSPAEVVNAAATSVAAGASSIGNELKRVTSNQEGEKWCPVVGVHQCPPSTPFHFYRCCGTLNNECCFNLQSWVLLVLITAGVGSFGTAALQVLRYFLCRRQRH